jgi:hypothetical protein
MSTAEKLVFHGGLVLVWVYPIGFFIVGGLWFFLALYLLINSAFFLTLKRVFCSRCMNFACPLNGVPEPVRRSFRKRNPSVGRAWLAE